MKLLSHWNLVSLIHRCTFDSKIRFLFLTKTVHTNNSVFQLTFSCDIGTISLQNHFILSHRAGFYKPTVPRYLPSHLQDYNTPSQVRAFSTFFIQALIQIRSKLFFIPALIQIYKKMVSVGIRTNNPSDSSLTSRSRLLFIFLNYVLKI